MAWDKESALRKGVRLAGTIITCPLIYVLQDAFVGRVSTVISGLRSVGEGKWISLANFR